LTTLQAEIGPSKGELDRGTDQFVTRVLGGKMTTELVIRLGNDFPTTEREVSLECNGSGEVES